MRAVIQRVRSSSVSIDDKKVAEIGPGLVILLGIGPEDDEKKAVAMARKIAMMRIFGDEEDKINLSMLDVGGDALVVSQFTLYADTHKGHRPSFIKAAPPELAEPLVEYFASRMADMGVPTKTGEFGAHMLVSIDNDGPVTILLEM